MGLYAKDSGVDFELHPEGQFNATCVDVIDLGELESFGSMKHFVRLVWLTSAKMDNGRPMMA